MRFYVATALERADDARAVAEALRGLGHEHTYDWTTHGSVQSEGNERIAEVAHDELRGVFEADLVVVLLPGGRGTHTELGAALAAKMTARASRPRNAVGGDRRIIIVGPLLGADERVCAFYLHPAVDRRFETAAELVAFMRGVGAGW